MNKKIIDYLKYGGVVSATCFVVFLVFIGIGIAKDTASTMDCHDAEIFRQNNPNNLYLFVLDEREKELGCNTMEAEQK